jgi:multiple sugar transport system substrate-binding protein
MLWSVSAQSKRQDDAVKLVDFFVADPEAGKVLGVERGVPPSSKVRSEISSVLGDLDRAQADYISFMSERVAALPPPPPRGAGEIATTLRRVNEQVGFGRLSPADGAKQFVTEASAILARG